MPDLDSPVTVTETSQSDVQSTQDSIKPLEFDSVQPDITQFFGFTPADELTEDQKYQMKFIWNHFATDAESPGEVLRLMREAERGMDPPHYDESRLGKLYTLIRLLDDEKSLKEEIRAYKKPRLESL